MSAMTPVGLTAREHAIVALCRIAGRSLDEGWRTFDDLSLEEKLAFATRIVSPVAKTILPILEAQFAAAMADARKDQP